MAVRIPLVVDAAGDIEQLPGTDTLDSNTSRNLFTITNGNAGPLPICTPVYMTTTAGEVDEADASAAATARTLIGLLNETIASAATGLVVLDGILTATTGEWDTVIVGAGVGGLTAGSWYFLSDTAGEIDTVPPTGSPKLVIKIGIAVSVTELDIQLHQSIKLA